MNKIEDTLFKEGLREGDLLKLRKASKVEAHNHCGLGMRFSTFNKWAGGKVNEPPKRIEGILGIDDYILGETIKFISKAEDIAFLIEATIREAIEDGVKILETSLDCHNIKYFESADKYFKTILNIKEKYSKYIDFSIEVGMAKSISTEDLNTMLIPCIDSGVFKSIDLYGDETMQEFERFKEYYKYAKKKGLKLKAHAGEFQGAENVKRAVEILELDEIQHGIGATSSEYVMDLIKERNIRLNICPSSNYILGAIKDMANYPAKKLFDKGIPITINTDDLLLFNSGVSQEYLYLYKLGIFDEDELNEIRKSSLA
jgi:adenosine deaminase